MHSEHHLHPIHLERDQGSIRKKMYRDKLHNDTEILYQIKKLK